MNKSVRAIEKLTEISNFILKELECPDLSSFENQKLLGKVELMNEILLAIEAIDKEEVGE